MIAISAHGAPENAFDYHAQVNDGNSNHPLRICSGRTKVNPRCFPVAVAGHGANVTANSLADSLEVNAIVMLQLGRRILVASFDLLYIGGELRRRIVATLCRTHGFMEEDIFLFASHTHFAPPTDSLLPALGPYDSDYATLLEHATLELVGTLLKSDPTPVRLEIRQGAMDFGVNRRRPRFLPTFTRTHGFSTDRVTFAPNPTGPRDTVATVITWKDARSDIPIAVIWNYGCHPVSHTPSDVVSADFPGVARDKLRSEIAPGMPVLFLQGFCGDVRPQIPVSQDPAITQRVIHEVRNLISGTPHMETSVSAWNTWSTALANALIRIATSKAATTSTPVSARSVLYEMPLERVFRGTLSQATMRIQGLRIGDSIEIIAFGAEPSAGWRSMFDRLLLPWHGVRLYSSYCGDVFGYLPCPHQVREGGYEVEQFQRLFGLRGKFLAPALESEVVNSTRSVVQSLAGTA